MKPRISNPPGEERHSEEFKGIVKKITGRLTGDRALEKEGQTEMLGRATQGSASPKDLPELDPDPHRRG